MNVDQIMRLGLYQADEVRQAGTASSFVTNIELLAWANDANRRLEAALRTVRADYFTRVMNSATDTATERIFGINYVPSTSLAIAASTTRFSLPPDFKYLTSIRCVTAGYEKTLFLPRDTSAHEFQSALRRASSDTASPGSTMWYDIIGDRTLHIVPALSTGIDIEMIYVSRTRPLNRYSTGTIAVTDGTTAVTGTSTLWLTNIYFDAAYLDMLFGTSGSSTVPTADPTIDYDQTNMSRVSSITNNTAIVLAANKNGTLAGGTGYLLSSIPQIPIEYHHPLADYVTARIILKRGGARSPVAAGFMGTFQAAIQEIRADASTRQYQEVEFVEDYDPSQEN